MEIKSYLLEKKFQDTPNSLWESNAYLFIGEEDFLKEELLEKVLKRVKIPKDNIEYIDASSKDKDNNDAVVWALETMAIDDWKKIVVIRNAECLSTAVCKRLYDAWETIGFPEGALPIFLANEVDGRRQLWKLVKEEGIWCKFWPMFEDRVPPWIQQRFESIQLPYTRGSELALYELCGNDLRKIVREINKLSIACDKVTPAIINEMVKKSTEASRYDLEDKFIARDISSVVNLIPQMKDKVEIKDIVFSFIRCVRCAIQSHYYLKQGNEFAQQILNLGKQSIALSDRKDWPGIAKRNEINKTATAVINTIPTQMKMIWTGKSSIVESEETEKEITTESIQKESMEIEEKKKGRGKKSKVLNFNADQEKLKELAEEKKKQQKEFMNEIYNYNMWATRGSLPIMKSFVMADNFSLTELTKLLLRLSKMYYQVFDGSGDLIELELFSCLVELKK